MLFMKPFLLIALLPTLAGAENILLVSNNNTNSQGLFDFLTTEGHTITRDPRQAGPLASDVTNFDIVIVTRATNSGDYANDANESAAWNSLSIPIINFNAYLYRASRWGWTTTEGLTAASTSGLDNPFVIPSHPFVQGLADPKTTLFTTEPGTASNPVADLIAGSEVIATRDAGANLGIFLIPPGTTLADTSGTLTSAARIGFTAGNGNEWSNINENGKQILRNIIIVTLNPSDSDGDGIDDSYELANTTPPSPTSLAPGNDDDSDGLTNLQEYLGQNSSGADHGFGQTRASLADTDEDGFDDHQELLGSYNTAFATEATNPNAKDTDEDGIEDNDEVSGDLNTAYASQPTNPANRDSDNDGMDDGYELANNTNGGLNPNFNDAAGNLDGDATPLTNLDEYLGTTLLVQTRADLLDTDADGYDDIVESNTGFWSSVTNTGTNPVASDTDNDTLLDGQENLDLAYFPGLSVFPTNSDPNKLHTDADGLVDAREATDYGTNPNSIDSDSDTFADDAELFAYQTDPADLASVPTQGQVDGLHINFTPGGSPVNGFQDYIAQHEVLSSFTPQIFNAFGGTVTVAASWNDGGSAVHLEAPQMIRRGLNLDLTEAPNLVRDFIGTDNRRVPGNPMTLTLSGLPAGTYQWTSYHHDSDNQTGIFDVTFTHAGGSDNTQDVEMTDTQLSGITEWEEFGTFSQTFISNGTDISIEFSSDSIDGVNPIQELFFAMSGFSVVSTAAAQGPTITDVSFTPEGNFKLKFIPATTGFILASSNDLEDSFSEVTSATFDGTDTFTIPAAFVSSAKNFFRIERP